jgi:hypothetical protein
MNKAENLLFLQYVRVGCPGKKRAFFSVLGHHDGPKSGLGRGNP